MLVKSNIYRELTAQVKGAAKLMVTVVAIQDLEAGDVLRRFKAEAAQDEPRHGNDNNRCIGTCVSLHMVFFSLWYFSFFPLKLGTKQILAPIPKSHHSAKTRQLKKKCTPDPTCSVLAAFPG